MGLHGSTFRHNERSPGHDATADFAGGTTPVRGNEAGATLVPGGMRGAAASSPGKDTSPEHGYIGPVFKSGQYPDASLVWPHGATTTVYASAAR